MKEAVNHPSHYQLANGMETIDIIRAGVEDIDSFCIGNTFKYCTRYNKKHESVREQIEDLKKAVWYLQYLIGVKEDECQKEINEFINKQTGGVQNG